MDSLTGNFSKADDENDMSNGFMTAARFGAALEDRDVKAMQDISSEKAFQGILAVSRQVFRKDFKEVIAKGDIDSARGMFSQTVSVMSPSNERDWRGGIMDSVNRLRGVTPAEDRTGAPNKEERESSVTPLAKPPVAGIDNSRGGKGEEIREL
jgi:hypothetical protein